MSAITSSVAGLMTPSVFLPSASIHLPSMNMRLRVPFAVAVVAMRISHEVSRVKVQGVAIVELDQPPIRAGAERRTLSWSCQAGTPILLFGPRRARTQCGLSPSEIHDCFSENLVFGLT